MKPSTPLTRIYREILASGDYEPDPAAVAEALLERLRSGRAV